MLMSRLSSLAHKLLMLMFMFMLASQVRTGLISVYFCDKRDPFFVSRTAITPKLKMRWFPNLARYSAEKL